jgi:transcriptional regulator with XRE-family HTH domain
MDDARIGRIARALRRRKGWRQIDLADRVGCHQTTISRLERGHLKSLSVDLLRRIFAELEAGLDLVVRWRAGDLERLLDERHARIVEAVAQRIAPAWELHPEVTYSEYGERGSIDLLALLPERQAAAVFEIKGEVPSVEGTIRKHGEKTRLAARVVERNWGWRPRHIARILVVEESMTARRVMARHAATFEAAYPATSRAVKQWLAMPQGPLSGIWFLSVKPRRVGSERRGGARRVRVPRRKAG